MWLKNSSAVVWEFLKAKKKMRVYLKRRYTISIVISKSLIPFNTFSQADEEQLPYRADLTDQKTHHKL